MPVTIHLTPAPKTAPTSFDYALLLSKAHALAVAVQAHAFDDSEWGVLVAELMEVIDLGPGGFPSPNVNDMLSHVLKRIAAIISHAEEMYQFIKALKKEQPHTLSGFEGWKQLQQEYGQWASPAYSRGVMDGAKAAGTVIKKLLEQGGSSDVG
jgi:hypothetical protein